MRRTSYVSLGLTLLVTGAAAACAAGSVDPTPSGGGAGGDDGGGEAASVDRVELDSPWPGDAGQDAASVDSARADAGPDVSTSPDASDAADATQANDAADAETGSTDTGVDGDAGVGDMGVDGDAGVGDADADAGAGDAGDSGTVTKPSVGDLLITEVMFDPSGTEPQAEWFEVYNLTATPKLLSGLTLKDGLSRTHVIAAIPQVVLGSQSYQLLVRDRTTAISALVPAAVILYEYGTGLPSTQGIQLANGTDGAIPIWDGTTELANVPYGPWGMSSNGKSIELKGLSYAGSDQKASFCLAANAWTTVSDDGTPGAASDCP